MNFIIPKELAQAILDYLAQHPYREVAAMVQAMQQLNPHPAPAIDTDPSTL